MFTYDERMRRAFDLGAIHRAYVERGLMAGDRFDQVLGETLAIRALQIEGLHWLLFDQLLSVCWDVPLDAHFASLGAGMDEPYKGIEDLFRRMIRLELFPPHVLNQTRFHHIPTEKPRMGALLHQLGLIDEITVQRALGIKKLIRDATGADPAVGQIFRSLGGLSIVDFFQVLGMQVGIEYRGLDESAPRIVEAAMRRRVPKDDIPPDRVSG